jgi:hypothetical protein
MGPNQQVVEAEGGGRSTIEAGGSWNDPEGFLNGPAPPQERDGHLGAAQGSKRLKAASLNHERSNRDDP